LLRNFAMIDSPIRWMIGPGLLLSMIGEYHAWLAIDNDLHAEICSMALATHVCICLCFSGKDFDDSARMLPYFDPEYENFNQRINPPRSGFHSQLQRNSHGPLFHASCIYLKERNLQGVHRQHHLQ